MGTELGVQLAREGHQVWGLKRDPSTLPPEIHGIQADLLAPGLTSRLPPVDGVVYAASAGGSSPDAYQAIYVEGVKAILAGLKEREGPPVRRFVFVSSTGVYGDSGGAWVDEETPIEDQNFRSRFLGQGEALVLESGIPATVLRLGGIYGPGRTRLLERVREGQARCPGDGPIWSNRIHRDDAARAIQHLLTLPAPKPIYLGVDDEPAPLCQVYRTLAGYLDAPEPVIDPDASRRRSNKRCSNRRLRASGFSFTYPSFREGYRAMIADGA